MNALVIWILELVGNSLWGFRPNLMSSIVEIHGGPRAILWFIKNMPKYESTLKKLGPERTHLLATVISGINGCQYCTYGHALSFQLHYFDKNDKLFPLDEKEMMLLSEKEEHEIVRILNRVFDATYLVQEKKDLKRLTDLRQNPDLAENDDDHRINHLIQMFAFLNSCGIEKQTIPDFAHDPIQKNRKLHQEYIKKKDRRLTYAFEKILRSFKA